MRAIVLSVLAVLSLGLLSGSAAASDGPTSISVGDTSWVSMVANTDLSGRTATPVVYRADAGDPITAKAGDDDIFVIGGDQPGGVDLTLAAPNGDRFAAGEYTTNQGATLRCAGASMDTTFDAGEFDIIDVGSASDGTINRLLATYRCGLSIYADVGEQFGVISINEPLPSGPLSPEPNQVTWPTTYPGRTESNAPVFLANDGIAPVALGEVQLAGPQAGNFSLTHDGCSDATVLPGKACEVDVDFGPSSSGSSDATVCATDLLNGQAVSVPLAGAAYSGTTEIRVALDSGPTRPAASYDLTPMNSVIGANGPGFTVDAMQDATQISYGVDFEVGAHLQAGHTYVDDVTDGSPRLVAYNFDPTPPWCKDPVTTLQVQRADYTDETLDAFAGTWETTCYDDFPAIRGSVAFHSPDGLPALPDSPNYGPGFVQSLRSSNGFDGTTLTWQTPPSPAWSRTVVRQAVGDVAPSSPTAGTPVYSGPADQVLIKGLRAAAGYTFSVFSVTGGGDYGPATSIHIITSRLSIRAPRYVSGRYAQLRGRLTTADGRPLRNERVCVGRILATRQGAPRRLVCYLTDAQGLARFKVAIPGNSRVNLSWPGDTGIAGTSSPTRLVQVEG